MAFVDEAYVTTWLRANGNLPQGTMLLINPADDGSVDGEVVVSKDDGEGGCIEVCSVQVGYGYLCVNTYGYTRPGDPGSLYMQKHGTWGVQPSDLEQVAATLRGLLTA